MPENNRTNRVPKLEPLSHFFVELPNDPANNNWVPTQNANQAYGPFDVNGNVADKYRVTAQFTAGSDLKARAMCKGTVLVVEQNGNNDKVNLILKPFTQPINGLAIKFFVYRGLNKSDFIDGTITGGTEAKLVAHNAADKTDLITKVWQDYIDFNQLTSGNEGEFNAKWMGFDPTVADTELIDRRFYNINTAAEGDPENKEYELPIVEMGDYIGNFNGEFGLDVVLSDGDVIYEVSDTGFYFNMEYARAQKWEFSALAADIPSGYAEKQWKEAILQFMDPAAYFGLHVGELGKLKYKTPDTPDGEFTGLDIYNNVMDPFLTKNKVYIQIMAENGRSYDFYGNYSSILPNNMDGINMRFGTEAGNLTDAKYGTLGWPIFAEDELFFDSGDSLSKVLLSLTNQVTNPVLHMRVGAMKDGEKNNFMNEDKLFSGSLFSNEVELHFSSNDSDIGISVLCIMQYYGAKFQIENTGLEEFDSAYTLFGLKQMSSVSTKLDSAIQVLKLNKDVLVPSLEQARNSANASLQSSRLIFDFIRIMKDHDAVPMERVLFESRMSTIGYKNSVLTSGRKNMEVSSHNTEVESFDISINSYYEPKPPNKFSPFLFIDRNEMVSGIRLTGLSDVDDTIYLGMSIEQYNELQDINSLQNSFVCLTSPDESSDTALNGIQKYFLGVAGENDQGELELKQLEEELIVYTEDDRLFYTKEYAQEKLEDYAEYVLSIAKY